MKTPTYLVFLAHYGVYEVPYLHVMSDIGRQLTLLGHVEMSSKYLNNNCYLLQHDESF